LYVAELSPARVRGLLVSLFQIGIVSGILAAYLLGWLIADGGPTTWRWAFAAGMLPALVLFASSCRLPESPRWLASHGATPAALSVLTSVMGKAAADGALVEIRDSLQQESGTWRDLLQGGTRRALRIGCVLSILSVTVGINAVIIYGPAILMRGAGNNATQALLGSVVMGVVNFVFTLAAMLVIDRAGRKWLLLCGLAGMALSMIGLGIQFRPEMALGPVGAELSAARSLGLLIPILCFVACYAVSLGPITWVLIAEIFPTKTRGAAMALCLVMMYLADFAVTFAFPWMMDQWGNGAFYVFAIACGLGILFVGIAVPETKGKSLEQIELLWTHRLSKKNTHEGPIR
jgi:SP family arabinose:H+ symporter-like MFS transporter